MNNNTVHLLSNTIYQIYNTVDFVEMRKVLLHSLRDFTRSECATLLMAANGENQEFLRDLLCDPMAYPEQYIELEKRYLQVGDRSYSRWQLQLPRSIVTRSSDLMSKHEQEQTELYARVFAPFHLKYALYLTIVYYGELLGIICLYRTEESGDYTEEDELFLQAISDHLNIIFYRNKHKQTANPKLVSAEKLAERYNLTEREREILLMVLAQKSNEEIEQELYISNNTLKKHLQNIYRKTDVSGRIDLFKLEKSIES